MVWNDCPICKGSLYQSGGYTICQNSDHYFVCFINGTPRYDSYVIEYYLVSREKEKNIS